MTATTDFYTLANNSVPLRRFVKAVTPTLVAGRGHSLFYLAGLPGAAVAPSPGIGGAVLTSYSGQLPYTNAVSGSTRLTRLFARASQAGSVMLCDRLWHNSGLDLTSTAEQTFTAAAQIPSRDRNGSNLGDGVNAIIEFSGAGGAGTPTLTFKYTNQAGTQHHTATNILATAASPAIGACYEFGLAAGDTGIQVPESLQLNVTWTSGTAHIVLYRLIAEVELLGAFQPNAVDFVTGGGPLIYDGFVPFIKFVPSTTTAANVSGHVIWSQG